MVDIDNNHVSKNEAYAIVGMAASLEIRLPGGMDDLGAPQFHAPSYISKLRRVMPLHQLRNALEKEVQGIRGKLTELVNEKHSDVVELANGRLRVNLPVELKVQNVQTTRMDRRK